MQKGTIGVTSDNIFPIIKKFLYSDHEIFLRELVSNAVDATQKLKTYASVGEFKGELGDLTVRVNVDKENKTITVTDAGVGLTEEEIEKYINQIAFSGAEEFLEKYKNDANAIIGHFGLGFYSSFMVSKKVEIVTRSFKDGAQAVRWSCTGSPEYTIEPAERETRGTDIILHIDDDNQDFIEEARITGLLTKYCKFLPIEIAFGKKKDWKDGKQTETDEDNIINNVKPAWTLKPADLKEEDYNKFYHELYPMAEDPLFNIHLNVDYPFNLTGILYFPKIKNSMDIHKNKIQLYCNQVFVTDSVEGVVPEFLTLLHGVIDSPDIPLNVSRSYLQSDGNVKKISSHITKKVADRLHDLYKADRAAFEEKWDNLKIFITYGMLSDEKFYERAEKFALLKNSEGKCFNYEEYKTLIKDNQTDKNKSLIYLYANDAEAQYSFINAARNKGYDVLIMDGQLDTHFVNHLESKFKDCRFVRVDSDIVDKLIEKDDAPELHISSYQKENVIVAFNSQLPKRDKINFMVSVEALKEDDMPVVVTQNEFMRRMKEMSQFQGGMDFYGTLPDSFNVAINGNHPLITKVIDDLEQVAGAEIKPIASKIETLELRLEQLNNSEKGKKDEEIPSAEKEEKSDLEKKIADLKTKKSAIIESNITQNGQVRQLIDLALLSNNMLKGEDLNNFIRRSIELI